jgi:hypothetical protein
MKPFNLAEAKAGKPVQLRDGRPATILTYSCRDDNYPIIALAHGADGDELLTYTLEGTFTSTSKKNDPLNLCMAPLEISGWLNIYPEEEYIFCNTKENAAKFRGDSCTATIKIVYTEGQFDDLTED